MGRISSLKLVMLKDEKQKGLSKDRVEIYTLPNGEKITLGFLLKKADFNENQRYLMVGFDDSVQIRPKAIYKNIRGYYIYDDDVRVFFTEEQCDKIKNGKRILKKYLTDLYENKG